MIVKLDSGDNYFSCFCVSTSEIKDYGEINWSVGLSYDKINETGLGMER